MMVIINEEGILNVDINKEVLKYVHNAHDAGAQPGSFLKGGIEHRKDIGYYGWLTKEMFGFGAAKMVKFDTISVISHT